MSRTCSFPTTKRWCHRHRLLQHSYFVQSQAKLGFEFDAFFLAASSGLHKVKGLVGCLPVERAVRSLRNKSMQIHPARTDALLQTGQDRTHTHTHAKSTPKSELNSSGTGNEKLSPFYFTPPHIHAAVLAIATTRSQESCPLRTCQSSLTLRCFWNGKRQKRLPFQNLITASQQQRAKRRCPSYLLRSVFSFVSLVSCHFPARFSLPDSLKHTQYRECGVCPRDRVKLIQLAFFYTKGRVFVPFKLKLYCVQGTLILNFIRFGEV